MPKETPSLSSPESVETMYSGTRMRYILEIFDLGKGAPEQKEERRQKFIELMRRYNFALKRSKVKTENDEQYYTQGKSRKKPTKEIHESDDERADIHNQIMTIIRNMSLSREATSMQKKVAEYLAANRKEVEKMISDYFSVISSSDPKQHDELHQALRGDGQFTGRREED